MARRGDAREESFYPALAGMLKAVASATGRTHVHVTTLPRPTEGGNPDFRLWNGKDRIIGYLEAKKPTEERLDAVEDSEQLRRYRSTFPNLILTNFLEFRLYRNGKRERTVVAARPLVLNTLGTSPPIEKPDELYALLDRFLGFALPPTFTAESLAIELAKRTHLLRDRNGKWDQPGVSSFEHSPKIPHPFAGLGNRLESCFLGCPRLSRVKGIPPTSLRFPPPAALMVFPELHAGAAYVSRGPAACGHHPSGLAIVPRSGVTQGSVPKRQERIGGIRSFASLRGIPSRMERHWQISEFFGRTCVLPI